MDAGLHIATAHDRGGYESLTPGIYARWNGPTVGLLRNSERRLGIYGGWTFETADKRWALTVGGMTGYRAAPVVPIAVPSVRFELAEHTALRLMFLAKAHKDGGAQALSLLIEREFK